MMQIVLWVGFSQSLFAAILVASKKNASVSDKILTAWLSLLAIEFLTCAIDYKIFGTPLLSSSFLLFNPAFYLYIKSLTDKNFKLKPIQLLHLLPFVFFEVFAYVFEETISLHTYFEADTTLGFRFAFALANFLSWILYNTLSFKALYRHRKNILHEFSSFHNQKKLGWTIFIFVIYNLYCLAAITIGIVVIIMQQRPLLPHIFNYSALLFLIYILGFYGLRQPAIYKKTNPDEEKESEERYKNSLLSLKQKNEIKNSILDFFETDKPYLNPDLNMDLLSNSLNIPKYHITEVLNTEIGSNFFGFVNKYRVEAVKKMLNDSKNQYSIEAIGYECGYTSKSSFFTVFKKLTGMTPMEYKKKKSDQA
ncbi:MAG: helix-turn-helix domain-containing protein [Ignavibacteriaceae bacterium]